MNSELLHKDAVAALLKQADIKGRFTIKPLKGGCNNRVYRIDVNKQQYCVKSYFNSPNDKRDRLGTEFNFLAYAWESGIRHVPCPLANDKKNNLGLYEFIKGRKLTSKEIKGNRIKEALRLYQVLNDHKNSLLAKELPNGSEACFSINDHLKTVDGRLQRLNNIHDSCTINSEAIQFIENDLLTLWDQVQAWVDSQIRSIGINLEKKIRHTDRCISPSDFGFHNAILTDKNVLRFVDFEYAGWDDPAKMTCDFFCQPAIQVPLKYFNNFAKTVSIDLAASEIHRKRFEILLPVYQIKWCCIMLNVFLPTDAKRREFANQSVDLYQQKIHQLQKARKALQKVRISQSIFH